MALFYRPENAVAGDVIPFFDDGVFKPFYLRNFRGMRDQHHQDGWVMLTTTDHVHYQEHDTHIVGGTGSVIKVDGTYHMFYCTFKQNPERNFVNHAVSADLDQWTDIPEHAFRPDEEIYAPVHWRDPFVFWNEDEGCWWMILAAQTQNPTWRRACVGLCKSNDLEKWKQCEPLYAPMAAEGAYECPDLFRMGGWYYLVYSSYADRYQTLYRMSKSLSGPWIKPVVDTFDTRAFYAAKTASDGAHRYIYGWNPTRQENDHGFDPEHYDGQDCNAWDWGGNLIVHALRQDADGTLWVSPVESVMSSVDAEVPVQVRPLSGDWREIERNGVAIDSPYDYASLLLGRIPDCCRLELTLSYSGDPARLGLALQVDESFAEGYYLIMEPHRQRVQYRTPVRMTEFGGQCFPYEVEMERPLTMIEGRPMKITLLIDGDILEAYFDERVALGTRMLDRKSGQFGLFIEGGSARFDEIRLFVPKG